MAFRVVHVCLCDDIDAQMTQNRERERDISSQMTHTNHNSTTPECISCAGSARRSGLSCELDPTHISLVSHHLSLAPPAVCALACVAFRMTKRKHARFSCCECVRLDNSRTVGTHDLCVRNHIIVRDSKAAYLRRDAPI